MIFKRNKLSPYTIYLLLFGVSSFALYTIFTINMVYQVEVVKLNPLQLVLVGTMLETVAFICQVPTGVLADVYSRRLSVILGYFLVGAGFLLEGLIPRFETILFAQVIWGLGASFTDGAEQAWLADEMGEEQVGRAFLRSSQVGQIAMLASVPISIGLATIRLNLPIIAGGSVLILLSLFLVLFMPENGFRPAPREERHSWKTMGRQMIEGARAVRQSPMLVTIACVTLFAGMASEGFDRLQTAHFIKDFVFPGLGQLKPVVWFGIINIVGTLLVLAVTEIVRRRIDTTNHHAIVGTLFAFNLVLIVSVAVFGLAGSFPLALAAYWCASVSRRANLPLYMTWLTQNSASKVRATVISLAGQVDAIGQIAGGPITGLVGNLISIRAAIVSTALMLAPNVFFFTRTLRQKKDTPVVVETGGESKPVEAIGEVVSEV